MDENINYNELLFWIIIGGTLAGILIPSAYYLWNKYTK